MMKFLSVAGTAAMFLVGGGILAHGIPPLHHWTEHIAEGGGASGTLVPMLVNAAVGALAGGIIVGVVTAVGRLRAGPRRPPPSLRSAQIRVLNGVATLEGFEPSIFAVKGRRVGPLHHRVRQGQATPIVSPRDRGADRGRPPAPTV